MKFPLGGVVGRQLRAQVPLGKRNLPSVTCQRRDLNPIEKNLAVSRSKDRLSDRIPPGTAIYFARRARQFPIPPQAMGFSWQVAWCNLSVVRFLVRHLFTILVVNLF